VCLPPPSHAVSILDVEQPLFASHDQEGGDSGEESDDGDDDPAHQAVADDTDTSADRLAMSKAIRTRRVFDSIVQPVDGREGGIPDADSVHTDDAFCSIEIWFSWRAVQGSIRCVIGRDRTLGEKEGRPIGEGPV
jgi:hypothetical protein